MSDVSQWFYAPCSKCKRKTRNKCLKAVTESGDSDYRFTESHEIIECQGCGNRSFRQVFMDEEAAYPIDEGEWEVPEIVTYYPSYTPIDGEIEKIYQVPEVVREIYEESMLAVQAGALTLAGLGLRGTIEAVCNNKNISGRNLEVRISKMASQGLISSKDSERLHAIRFLGNDAAHEIKKPGQSQISVALKIINHLIQSVYLLEIEMRRKLDTIISNPEEFEGLLNKHLEEFSPNDEYPLAKFLGKDIRRLGQSTSVLETHLMKAIASGDYTKFKVGKVAKFSGSKEMLQHFIVV